MSQYQQPKKGKGLWVAVGILAGLVIILGGFFVGILLGGRGGVRTGKNNEESLSSSLEHASDGSEDESSEDEMMPTIVALQRPRLVGKTQQKNTKGLVPVVQSIQPASDLSNVDNLDLFHLSDETKKMLIDNGFAVVDSYSYEFFELYESNRYIYIANFITVDSMMHTYHLYFQYLMKNIERTSLSSTLLSVSKGMLEASQEQYESLKGSEWEDAAKKNMAFFAIGALLQDPDVEVPAEVSELVETEVERIEAHKGIDYSLLTGILEDYTQYIPRGYYENEELLQRYFKAMMWYGRLNFKQKEEDLDRCAFLMTLALHDHSDILADWEAIYTVTSFFAGVSDDSGYYEYYPVIEAAFGEDVQLEDLPGAAEKWTAFHDLTAKLDPPKINSVPMPDTEGQVDNMDENKGFRFMGQRFTIDEAIFQNLTYSKVDKKSSDDYRMLPDVLDMMAALGSEEAMDLLEQQGDTSYPNYLENMEQIKQEIENSSDDQWSCSLYASWLNTLRPLLKVKGEGYPSFMQTEAWQRKNLESFAGSYAELKHDTILYAKQMMAEMGGGGEIPVYDDRGYVEPEPEVFSRLSCLTQDTRDGLKAYGYLSSSDEENLTLLAELAEKLMVIAEKELTGELPTDDEFELIRTYGGTLEHFWEEVYKDEPRTMPYLTTKEFPSPIVADIATDPNGYCLEVATGKPATIYVLVEVDGVLKIATGKVFSFYQFEWPMNDRLTDSAWRAMMGIELNDSGTYTYESEVEQPWWCTTYRVKLY